MKTYTYDEVNVFIKELETGRDEIQNKISGLREKQKSLKLLDFKGKQEIDKEIEDFSIASRYIRGDIDIQASFSG